MRNIPLLMGFSAGFDAVNARVYSARHPMGSTGAAVVWSSVAAGVDRGLPCAGLWRGAFLAMVFGLALLQAHAGEPPAPEPWELGELCSFTLDFEDTLVARFAEGDLRPAALAFSENGKTQYLPPGSPVWTNCFVPGLRGRALSTRNGHTDFSLSYPAVKNFNSRQGSILFWMKYEEVVPGPAGNLCFNVPGVMYINMAREVKGGRTNEQTAIWFAPIPEVKGRNNGWMVLGRPAPWKPRTWHHVALTWGLDDIRYYEDGVLLGKQAYETGRPMPENMAGQFSVVLAGWGGTNHDTVVMDEFCVFPAALPESLVKEEYRRLGPE